jgi:hypothetical protein
MGFSQEWRQRLLWHVLNLGIALMLAVTAVGAWFHPPRELSILLALGSTGLALGSTILASLEPRRRGREELAEGLLAEPRTVQFSDHYRVGIVTDSQRWLIGQRPCRGGVMPIAVTDRPQCAIGTLRMRVAGVYGDGGRWR